jgi:NAD(P)-dependent dehydrogenase (short-subunit alcohol dehydrogenase family)
MFAPLNPRIRDWRGQRVWLVGASSGIGAALAGALFARGARVAVSARRAPPLEALVPETARGRALVVPVDVTDAQSVAAAHRQVLAQWGGVDLTIWLAGTYAPMRAGEFRLAEALNVVRTNLEGVLNGLATLLPVVRSERRGGIAIVSSVAGYRGLPRSLVYGPTKAALNNLAESLYLDLHPLGVGVYLINPGFVQTPLTALNDFRMPALITAEDAAQRILAGFATGAFEIHFPARFTRAMKSLQLLPHRLYFSLVRRLTRSDRGAAHGAQDAVR